MKKNAILLSVSAMAFIATGLVMTPREASAAFVQGTCGLTDVTATDGSTSVNASACLNYSGNDNNYSVGAGPAGYENYITADFGVGTDWEFFGKDNTPGGPEDGIGSVDATGSGAQSGDWTVDPKIDGPFVIVLKAANFFAAYLFSSFADVTGGTFSVVGVTTDCIPGPPKPDPKPCDPKFAGLSHLTVYTTGTSVVPVPAALPLLVTGLAGLGFLARRRAKKSA